MKMKTTICIALLGLTAPAWSIVPIKDAPAAGRAGVATVPPVPDMPDLAAIMAQLPNMMPTEGDLEAARAGLEAAVNAVKMAQERVAAGLLPPSGLDDLKVALAERQNTFDKTRTAFSRRQSAASMNRLVDVQLKNAPVRQVADALSRASGLKISVAQDVPQSLRVSVDSRRIPLATVLEAVARQSNLVIAPQEGGAILQPYPTLSVNGSSSPVHLNNPPWSNEWGLFPPRSVFSNFLDASGMGGMGISLSTPPGANSGKGGNGSGAFIMKSGIGGGNFSMAGVGDHIVIAEPGNDESGNPGVWMTVYALNGDNLAQVSKTFHKSPSEGVRKMTLNTEW